MWSKYFSTGIELLRIENHYMLVKPDAQKSSQKGMQKEINLTKKKDMHLIHCWTNFNKSQITLNPFPKKKQWAITKMHISKKVKLVQLNFYHEKVLKSCRRTKQQPRREKDVAKSKSKRYNNPLRLLKKRKKENNKN